MTKVCHHSTSLKKCLENDRHGPLETPHGFAQRKSALQTDHKAELHMRQGASLGVEVNQWTTLWGRQQAGANIDSVQPGSAAEKAGLRPGQVITAIDSKPIDSPLALANALTKLKPGMTCQLTLSDHSQKAITLDRQRAFAGLYLHQGKDEPLSIGATTDPVATTGLDGERDKLLRIDGKSITSIGQYHEIISRKHAGDLLQIDVERSVRNKTSNITITCRCWGSLAGACKTAQKLGTGDRTVAL